MEEDKVQFQQNRNMSRQKAHELGAIEKVVMQLGVVKTRKQANYVLLLIALTALGFAVYLFYTYS